MRIAQVHIQVKPDGVDAFIQATTENARRSLQEDGVVRFDLLRSDDKPTSFILFEVYRSADAQAAHKETAHFAHWREAVKDLIVAPGRAAIYANVFPGDDSWT